MGTCLFGFVFSFIFGFCDDFIAVLQSAFCVW